MMIILIHLLGRLLRNQNSENNQYVNAVIPAMPKPCIIFLINVYDTKIQMMS